MTIVICPKARPCFSCGELTIVNGGHKCGVRKEPLKAGAGGAERTRRNWVFNSPDNYRYKRIRTRIPRSGVEYETW